MICILSSQSEYTQMTILFNAGDTQCRAIFETGDVPVATESTRPGHTGGVALALFGTNRVPGQITCNVEKDYPLNGTHLYGFIGLLLIQCALC